MNQWVPIAQNYEVERDILSLPAILVDDLVMALMNTARQGKVLDFGAGSGTLTRLLARQGHNVTAYEPNAPMRNVMVRANPADLQEKITILEDIEQVEKIEQHDSIICINVVDHLLDVLGTFKLFREKIKPGGRFILCIPHPMKNIGSWVKERNGSEWDYVYYRLDGYMSEGAVKRDREDVKGNLIIKDVISQHRTMSTYYNWVIDAGFDVVKMHEPGPKEEHKTSFPAHYKQCSRIPYFWILDCIPRQGKSNETGKR